MGSVLFLEPQTSQESSLFVLHSLFNPLHNTDNVGIIRLTTPVVYSNTLRAILIPGLQHAGNQYVNAQSYISGYGVYVEGMSMTLFKYVEKPMTYCQFIALSGSNYLSNQLRFSQQVTLTNAECQQSFDQRYVQTGSICAKSNTTQAACHGDIGGALVVQYNDTWLQIGIASTINPNGCSGPTVYTRLTSYIDWIRAMTGISNDG